MSPHIVPHAETEFHVADLAAARDFYQRVFGLPIVFEDAGALGFQLSGGSVLMLFASDRPRRDGTDHLRFEIPVGSLDDWDRHLMVCGIAVESRVRQEDGAVSLFFRDPDLHSIELAMAGACPAA